MEQKLEKGQSKKGGLENEVKLSEFRIIAKRGW